MKGGCASTAPPGRERWRADAKAAQLAARSPSHVDPYAHLQSSLARSNTFPALWIGLLAEGAVIWTG